jgi:hypothetical protein
LIVLLHSPLAGPGTWEPVARELVRRGHEVLRPELADAQGSGLPFWRQHAESAARELRPRLGDRPPVLAGHSGAGPLLPAVRQALGRPVAAYAFVDAGLPRDGASRLDLLAEEALGWIEEFRRHLASGGRFPEWTEEQLRPLIPDPELRRAAVQGLRPRGLAFFEEPIPVFAGWPDAPCVYLQLSAAYAIPAARVQSAGWPFRRIEGGHFHLLAAPEQTADALLELLGRAGA